MPPRSSVRALTGEAARLAAPYFRSSERASAWALLACVIGFQLLLVGIAVLENYWRNAFFEALQQRSWDDFLLQFWVFCAIGIGFISGNVYQRYFTQWLSIRWRRWLTDHFLSRWLDGPVHYRAQLAGAVDNPDQRLSEDIRQYIDQLIALGVGLIGAIAKLVSFVAILWTLSNLVPLRLFGIDLAIPGYLVWAALAYAVLGTIVTHLIGRPLIPLDFERERREADFRHDLVRLRDHAEAVALLRGEAEEHRGLMRRFAAIAANWYRIMHLQQIVSLFTTTYRYYSRYFPYLIMAPMYFGGSLAFGALMQAGQAFNIVRDAFSYLVESYLKLTEFGATVQRLTGFAEAATAHAHPPASVSSSAHTGRFVAENVSVHAPGGATIGKLSSLDLRPGESRLLVGPSGSGKTSVLRALAGVWPHARGRIEAAESDILALPQRPYIPKGSLRRVVSYPREEATYGEPDLTATLDAVGLSLLAPHLDTEQDWNARLSEGEKQRLSIARAILFRPDILLLDEATSALDHDSERILHALIRQKLPETTIIATAHEPLLSPLHDETQSITD